MLNLLKKLIVKEDSVSIGVVQEDAAAITRGRQPLSGENRTFWHS